MGQLLVGSGKDIRAVPDDAFLQAHHAIPEHMAARLAFMSPDHHAVRDFVVREMPGERKPISPLQISKTTGLGLGRTVSVLAELEQHLFFLVRDENGDVSWAYPVTTARTAHRLTFSTGERISGA